MKLLLSIFISFIAIQLSFAGSDLTGKTIICETYDGNIQYYDKEGFINKWLVYGFLDNKNLVKLEYGYNYKMEKGNSFEKDYMLGGVATEKEGVYSDYSEDDSFLYFEFKNTVKETSYKNNYEKGESVLKCGGMHGADSTKKNHCNIEILNRQTLQLQKTYVNQKTFELKEFIPPRYRADCKLGDDNNLKNITDVVGEIWIKNVQEGMADSKRKIKKEKSKNQL